MTANPISPEQLQEMLRSFGGPMTNIKVEPHNVIPTFVRISGVCNIHGNPFFFETDFNLREISGPEEVIRLAGMFLDTFKKAEKGIPT